MNMMAKVDGKPWHCRCGSNVQTAMDEHTFSCNGCHRIYTDLKETDYDKWQAERFSREPMSPADVKQILAAINLPAWYREVEWKVEDLSEAWKNFWLNDPLPISRFRIEYMEPDVDTGQPTRQYARWWYVESDFSPDAVIKTAWLALSVSDEHRRREAFSVNGNRIFEPHKKLELGDTNV